ncbi:MAG: exo-alpha-sialidase [Verrucomicrobia bacterium]|nr:exo-alpha-sialidase [Verrucomicrobiota bacterium]
MGQQLTRILAGRPGIPLGLILALLLPALRGLAESDPAPKAAYDGPGVAIDHSPARGQRFIGSPSLVFIRGGHYLASHDFFGPGSTYSRTAVFESTDRGVSWAKVAEVEGQFWSTLFSHWDGVYLMGTSRENGDVVIRRSLDRGRTWSTPRDAESGLLTEGGMYHTAPVPVIVHEGRVWRAMEDVKGPGGWGSAFRSFMMSAPVESDLLRRANWTASEPMGRNPEWLNGQFGGWLEGNAVVAPDGSVVNVLRVDYRKDSEKAAIIRIDSGGLKQRFDPASDIVDFPGGCKKFTIRHDPESKRYWSLVNHVPRPFPGRTPDRVRNTLALASSSDLKRWEIRGVLLQHPDPETHGFQYCDWLFETTDLIAVSRTAYDDGLGGAHNQHDANFLTFHRVKDFRAIGLETNAAPAGDTKR